MGWGLPESATPLSVEDMECQVSNLGPVQAEQIFHTFKRYIFSQISIFLIENIFFYFME